MTSRPCWCATFSASRTSSAVTEKRLRGESSRRLTSACKPSTSRPDVSLRASASRPSIAPHPSCRRDVLPTLESVEGCMRLQGDAANGRVQLLEAPCGADKRAARSECGHEVCDTASGLLPDFAGRGAVVRLPVGRIAVLIGIKIFLRLGRHDLVNPANSPRRALLATPYDPLC